MTLDQRRLEPTRLRPSGTHPRLVPADGFWLAKQTRAPIPRGDSVEVVEENERFRFLRIRQESKRPQVSLTQMPQPEQPELLGQALHRGPSGSGLQPVHVRAPERQTKR